MATLLQLIDGYIDNITVTDRQEDNIAGSIRNLTDCLTKKDNGMYILKVFTNGSYERDTIIRPLNDIDLFAVLDPNHWKDEYGALPTPQSVLTSFKNYLNAQNDYKGKVKQDRPCVTIELSDKNFDVLPSFAQAGGGYLIPNYDLTSWTHSFPEQLTQDLNTSNKDNNYKIKPTVKAIKHWNRENNKLIPSYHIEETVITIFRLSSFSNYEESIRIWFNAATSYLQSHKFKSLTDHTSATNKITKVKDKLNTAKKLSDEGKSDEAKAIWKEVFGKEFPSTTVEEAKQFSQSLKEGALKISATGILSTTAGKAIPASKGFYGE